MTPEKDSAARAGRVDRMADLARTASLPLAPEKLADGLAVVSARLTAHKRQRSRQARLALAMVGVMVALGGLGWGATALRSRTPATLSFTVEGGEIIEGGYLRALGSTGVQLRFAEGTVLNFPAGTRGRLRGVDDKGARIALEQGKAWISVVHRTGARWQLEAGPFLVVVQGTAFSAAWDGASERLDLRMQHGQVSVSGPLSEGEIAVRAGQQLTVSLPKKEVMLRELPAAELARDVPPQNSAPDSLSENTSETLTPTPEPPTPSLTEIPSPSVAKKPTVRAPTVVRSWPAALAAGDADGILREATQRGLPLVLARSSSEDLAALADAARYRRRDTLARQVLSTQRQRFPGSERAHEAAFLLGRLEESTAEGERKALDWYNIYLGEGPMGAYASEALGRKMITLQKLSGNAASQALAEEYLRRFPNGSYASIAKRLRQDP